ncbi:hypothetical protein MTR67_041505, partial [Solanum verrucosum]
DNIYIRHSADRKIRCGIVAEAIICYFRVPDLHNRGIFTSNIKPPTSPSKGKNVGNSLAWGLNCLKANLVYAWDCLMKMRICATKEVAATEEKHGNEIEFCSLFSTIEYFTDKIKPVNGATIGYYCSLTCIKCTFINQGKCMFVVTFCLSIFLVK